MIPESLPDPCVRRFVPATRIVWTSNSGVTAPQSVLTDDSSACILSPTGDPDAPASLVLDFGQELHGGVRLDVPTTSTGRKARVRVRFGESVTEAMSAPNNDHTIHDFDTYVAWMGRTEIGATGFRFVRIDLLDTEATVTLRLVQGVLHYRDLPYYGTFECSDERLNEIFRVGAYTVHLCLQDHVWDGIKRDRLVWIGDLHPEAMVVSCIFGGLSIVPETLDWARDHTPLPRWMNGISSYSLWWVIIQRDWYNSQGDRPYLEGQRDYLKGLLSLIAEHIDSGGREALPEGRFLEWPTSGDPVAVHAGLQALAVLTLRAGAELCVVLGETAAAAAATEAANRAAAYEISPRSESKQACALLALAGMANPNRTNASVLSNDPYRGLSTFYGYYVLQARALAGDYAGALDLIRTYWGGMIDRGATTFWEGFEIDWLENSGRIDEITPEGQRDLHADFGDWCYKGLRHSLCHGWAAGPTAWLMEHILGITPATPGFGLVRVQPHLDGLDWARGTYPTPHGIIRVEHTRRADGTIHTEIQLPDGAGLAPRGNTAFV
jgi:alpha-L-rhamnosidase